MKPKLLIVGSGLTKKIGGRFDDFVTHTLDIDKRVEPTFVGDIREMPFEDESYDCILASHVLEHITFPDVAKALTEMYRVLKPGSEIFFEVPNLEYACELILAGRGIVPVYTYKHPGKDLMVNVTPMDMLYGWTRLSEGGWYGHKCGFTRDSLFAFLGVFDWYMLRVHEHRVLGELDRCSLRAYGVKPGQAAYEPISDWMREGKDLNCGDPYVLKGGICDAVPSQENHGGWDPDGGSIYRA